MADYIMPIIIGAFIIFLGIQNLRGNISTLHRYHRKRVSEQDRLPFGRMVGIGTIICGDAIILKACFEYVAMKTGNPIFGVISNILLIVCLIIGFVIIIFAMFKYNKGLF